MGNSASNHHKEVVQGALAFLDYGEACRLPVLFAPPFLPSGLDFWQRACERLADERALALPRACDILEALEVLGCPSWRHLFARLWLRRHAVVAAPPLPQRGLVAADVSVASTTLRCVCRFRPASCFVATAENRSFDKVTIPLHQRVALVKQRDPTLGPGAALKRALAIEAKARDETETSCVRASVVGVSETRVHAIAPGCGAKTFVFDRVLGEAASQHEVWLQALPTVHEVLNGRDGCVFCYGQSGSGKTHTMYGGGGADDDGLVRRALLHLLEHSLERPFSVRVTCLEVFGNLLRDLVTGDALRKLRPTELELVTAADVDAFLLRAAGMKRSAATAVERRPATR